jgi:hypothetical protein
MDSAVIQILIIITIPIIAAVAGNYLLMHISGRDKFPQTTDPVSKPLNLRWTGYSQKVATDYWSWLLSNHAIVTEQRFLKMDLLYAVLYGGAMLFSALLAWDWLGRLFNPLWVGLPVIFTVVSDWTENLMHLSQLGRFVQGLPVKENRIRVASFATEAKWIFLSVSSLLILGLSIWILLAGLKKST